MKCTGCEIELQVKDISYNYLFKGASYVSVSRNQGNVVYCEDCNKTFNTICKDDYTDVTDKVIFVHIRDYKDGEDRRVTCSDVKIKVSNIALEGYYWVMILLTDKYLIKFKTTRTMRDLCSYVKLFNGMSEEQIKKSDYSFEIIQN